MAMAKRPWSVRACLLYTLSCTLYLELAEYSLRLRKAGRCGARSRLSQPCSPPADLLQTCCSPPAAHLPPRSSPAARLQRSAPPTPAAAAARRSSPNSVSFESTIAFLESTLKLCSTAIGDGHVRQALEMMLERLTAMAHMRHFYADAANVRRSGERVRGFLRATAAQQQQQQQQAAAAGSAAVPAQGARGAGGAAAAGKGSSPGDSATSCQDVAPLPGSAAAAAAAAAAAGLPVMREVADAQERVTKTVGCRATCLPRRSAPPHPPTRLCTAPLACLPTCP
jgi:hypothetical protein